MAMANGEVVDGGGDFIGGNKRGTVDERVQHRDSSDASDTSGQQQHLMVTGLYDDESQERKSSISFDKLKQISLTYSLQSEDELSPAGDGLVGLLSREEEVGGCQRGGEDEESAGDQSGSCCLSPTEPGGTALGRKISVIEFKGAAGAGAKHNSKNAATELSGTSKGMDISSSDKTRQTAEGEGESESTTCALDDAAAATLSASAGKLIGLTGSAEHGPRMLSYQNDVRSGADLDSCARYLKTNPFAFNDDDDDDNDEEDESTNAYSGKAASNVHEVNAATTTTAAAATTTRDYVQLSERSVHGEIDAYGEPAGYYAPAEGGPIAAVRRPSAGARCRTASSPVAGRKTMVMEADEVGGGGNDDYDTGHGSDWRPSTTTTTTGRVLMADGISVNYNPERKQLIPQLASRRRAELACGPVASRCATNRSTRQPIGPAPSRFDAPTELADDCENAFVNEDCDDDLVPEPRYALLAPGARSSDSDRSSPAGSGASVGLQFKQQYSNNNNSISLLLFNKTKANVIIDNHDDFDDDDDDDHDDDVSDECEDYASAAVGVGAPIERSSGGDDVRDWAQPMGRPSKQGRRRQGGGPHYQASEEEGCGEEELMDGEYGDGGGGGGGGGGGNDEMVHQGFGGRGADIRDENTIAASSGAQTILQQYGNAAATTATPPPPTTTARQMHSPTPMRALANQWRPPPQLAASSSASASHHRQHEPANPRPDTVQKDDFDDDDDDDNQQQRQHYQHYDAVKENLAQLPNKIAQHDGQYRIGPRYSQDTVNHRPNHRRATTAHSKGPLRLSSSPVASSLNGDLQRRAQPPSYGHSRRRHQHHDRASLPNQANNNCDYEQEQDDFGAQLLSSTAAAAAATTRQSAARREAALKESPLSDDKASVAAADLIGRQQRPNGSGGQQPATRNETTATPEAFIRPSEAPVVHGHHSLGRELMSVSNSGHDCYYLSDVACESVGSGDGQRSPPIGRGAASEASCTPARRSGQSRTNNNGARRQQAQQPLQVSASTAASSMQQRQPYARTATPARRPISPRACQRVGDRITAPPPATATAARLASGRRHRRGSSSRAFGSDQIIDHSDLYGGGYVEPYDEYEQVDDDEEEMEDDNDDDRFVAAEASVNSLYASPKRHRQAASSRPPRVSNRAVTTTLVADDDDDDSDRDDGMNRIDIVISSPFRYIKSSRRQRENAATQQQQQEQRPLWTTSTSARPLRTMRNEPREQQRYAEVAHAAEKYRTTNFMPSGAFLDSNRRSIVRHQQQRRRQQQQQQANSSASSIGSHSCCSNYSGCVRCESDNRTRQPFIPAAAAAPTTTATASRPKERAAAAATGDEKEDEVERQESCRPASQQQQQTSVPKLSTGRYQAHEIASKGQPSADNRLPPDDTSGLPAAAAAAAHVPSSASSQMMAAEESESKKVASTLEARQDGSNQQQQQTQTQVKTTANPSIGPDSTTAAAAAAAVATTTNTKENQISSTNKVDVACSAGRDLHSPSSGGGSGSGGVGGATTSGCPLFAQIPTKPLRPRNLLNGEQMVDTLHAKYKPASKSHGCTEQRCLGSMMNPRPVENKVRPPNETLEQAKDFIDNFYASIKRVDSPAHKQRLSDIEEQLRTTETYYLKETELIYGAKLAWRNASRCIGRIQWSKLQVFDARFTSNAQEMFEALCNHIKYATNKGSLRSAITILPQRVKSAKNDWRIWNSQLIGYAGYRDPKVPDRVVGDPANADFTEVCQRLGWRGKGGRFDVLPLVLQANGGEPQLFQLPEELVLRVKIKHPKYKWFEELGLEWYALPAVSSMMLDVGGLQFTAAPFSGWYMVTEVGTRDLGDSNRYNVLEEVALKLGLNTTSNMSLWKDQALVELNIAVLDSFQSQGVTIVDHHTASETFMTHLANEQRLRGGCPADWVWLVPPTSGSTMQVFHQEMVNYHLLPNYEYLEPVWKSFDWLAWEQRQLEKLDHSASSKYGLRRNDSSSSMTAAAAAAAAPTTMLFSAHNNHGQLVSPFGSPSGARIIGAAAANGGELTPRKLRFKEIARAVKFTSKLFGKALSRRIKATILYATETGKSERFANKLAQTFSTAFNVHLMSMSDYDMTCLEHEALLLIVTSTFGNGDPPENGELFAKHLAAVKMTGDTSPDIDSINSVSSNPFFQMLSEDHKDGQERAAAAAAAASGRHLSGGGGAAGQNDDDDDDDDDDEDSDAGGGGGDLSTAAAKRRRQLQRDQEQKRQEQQTNIRPLSNVRFGVFALGSTAYPHFCAFGRYVDQTLGELGAERILKCACGDELCGQEKAFNEWSSQVFRTACDVFCLTDSIGPIEERPETMWSPADVKFVPVELIGPAAAAAAAVVAPALVDLNNNSPTVEPDCCLMVDAPQTATISSSAKQQAAVAAASELLTSKKTIVRNLMSITNKRIIPFTVKRRADLHKFRPEENLQTLCIDLESDPPSALSYGSAGSASLAATGGSGAGSKLLTTSGSIASQSSASSITTSFEAGDHVAIYPVNKLEMVDKIIERMRDDLSRGPASSGGKQQATAAAAFDFDQVYTILVKRENMDLTPAMAMAAASQAGAGPGAAAAAAAGGLAAGESGNNWIAHERLPVTSIREALTRYLDITGAPNQEFLLMLSRQASDPEERKRLQQMARNFTIYEEWKIKRVPCLLSVLEEFKTIKFEPALVTQIPLMKPRFYSISGTTTTSLTLGVVRFKTSEGEPREGLCSNYLNRVRIEPAEHIYGYIRSAPAFHMPPDKSVPMILISAGTGIAPFRSFWQQRQADLLAVQRQAAAAIGGAQQQQQPDGLTQAAAVAASSSFGRIELYFGCRNSNYILYKDELEEMYEKGVLSSIRIAFSRPIDCDVHDDDDDDGGGDPESSEQRAVATNNEQDTTSNGNKQAAGRSFKIAQIKQARRRLYVQEKLLEDSDLIYRLIMFDGAHVYVCGDVAMADGVYKTLAIIFNNSLRANKPVTGVANSAASRKSLGPDRWPSQMNEPDAAAADLLAPRSSEDGDSVLMNLRNLNRYHEDIFGAKQVS